MNLSYAIILSQIPDTAKKMQKRDDDYSDDERYLLPDGNKVRIIWKEWMGVKELRAVIWLNKDDLYHRDGAPAYYSFKNNKLMSSQYWVKGDFISVERP